LGHRSTGQDQVLSIKKELLLLVPTLKIWLDVEVLVAPALAMRSPTKAH
jgi:hypothetical protein